MRVYALNQAKGYFKMRTSLFQQILLPIIVFGILHNSLAENAKSNLQNTAANQPQTNGVDDAIKYKRLKNIVEFQKEWVNPRKRQSQRSPIYQAIYRSGDWNCNSNAFKNFAVAVSNLTQGKVRLTCDTIDISTDKLFRRKPSFIYFTGNKLFICDENKFHETNTHICNSCENQLLEYMSNAKE